MENAVSRWRSRRRVAESCILFSIAFLDMADLIMDETSTVNELSRERPHPNDSLFDELAWRFWLARVWARYLLAGRRQGLPAQIEFLYQNYFFQPAQVCCELNSLGEIVAELQPQRALEIGTANGGTLLFLTRLASPTATLASIDLEAREGGCSAERQWFYEHFARRKQHLHLLRGSSHSFWMRRRLGEVFDGRPLDYVFIDGDHRYEGVKKDFETYGSMVRKGGVVAFHGIAEHPPESGCQVAQFWDEVKAQYRHSEFIEDRKQGWGGIGVLFVE